MQIKMFTRALSAKFEPEIYFTPLRKDNEGNRLVVGRVLKSETLADGKRQLTIEIDDRNKNRFKDVGEEAWVEQHFEINNKRRLMLPTKKRS
ncbi:hypothetical protein pEaSNUABM10_00232 [Erwinia phage pEa_SNUABM_10]|nr:hypothetical protein pEaSNUABM10_00232 [Erwinia phage pEa_SNUABM_10]QVW56367.1 hypothetical protein pEaSNUABM6_00231 [Erwinia phage pEa_SNUABM_6]